jgi:hypothetical protein
MRILKRIFPFTKTGLLYAFASLIILLHGIINADLAALFWSSGILTITTAAFILNHITYLLIKRKTENINIKVPVSSLFPGDSVVIMLETNISDIFVPGIIIMFCISFRWKKRKPLVFTNVIKTGKNTYLLEAFAEKRGFYRADRFKFHIRDYFGLFQSTLIFTIDEKIPVFPNQTEQSIIYEYFKGTDSIRYLKTPVSADEFFEVRKYYPGDDPKKINWKMFAHTNELFIRKKEETPPPKSNILFIIDSYETKLINKEFSDLYLDKLIELAASIILIYLKDYSSVMIFVPGYNSVYNIYSKNELLTLLSGLYWHKNTDINIQIPDKHVNTVIFSSADSKNLKNLLSIIKKRDWDINLYFKLFESQVMQYRKLSIRNLLFYNTDTEKLINHDYSASVNRNIMNKIDKYKKSPWKISNVKAI